MKNIEKIIREVNGTMSIEGMPITENDKNRIRTCLSDSSKFDSALDELIKKHTVVRENGGDNNHDQRLQL